MNEAVEKYDTHRYSDEMVQCVVESFETNYFESAISNYQYTHKLGVDDTSIGNEF